jgi:hypothetical protein
MNSAYKHLDSKLRIADLSLMQWGGMLLGALIAIAWAFYVKPFGSYLTFASGVYLGAIPAGLAVMSGFYEVDLATLVASAVSWKRVDGRFVAGAGDTARGYVVAGGDEHQSQSVITPSTLDLGALWGS